MKKLFVLAATAAFPVGAHAAPLQLDLSQLTPENPAQSVAPLPPPPPVLSVPASWPGAFAAIRGQRWAEAQAMIDALPDGPIKPVAQAELFTTKGSPKVDLDPLLALLARAPELPQAPQLARMAAKRGAIELPALPTAQELRGQPGPPRRLRTRAVTGDTEADLFRPVAEPLIRDNQPAQLEALLAEHEALMGADALTEWRQRAAWSYYTIGDDANALRLATLARGGSGEWAAQADWVAGLAAWRSKDFANAANAFASAAGRAGDGDMAASANYWAARADTAAAHPQTVQARLKVAARYPETFYGMLAREALGMKARPIATTRTAALAQVERRPNIQAAIALNRIGEGALAAELIRYQARIGSVTEHSGLIALAARMDMPNTQMWLALNAPAGATIDTAARYPAPSWAPAGGWRVDRSLILAHTLQESVFRADAVSPAGARGLMQLMPGTARELAFAGPVAVDSARLNDPVVNFELGQRNIEKLRDSGMTGGQLLKVIAAYNAGPAPVQRWNVDVKCNDDPLLYIESIPYWETRSYVPTILRNYWMYQQALGQPSESQLALAQGKWPRFPAARRTQVAQAGGGGPVAGAD